MTSDAGPLFPVPLVVVLLFARSVTWRLSTKAHGFAHCSVTVRVDRMETLRYPRLPERVARLKRELPDLTSELGLLRLCANKKEVCAFGTIA
jgi:hypothetical protein